MLTLQGQTANMIGLVSVGAGTAWYAVVPGTVNLITRITGLQVDNGATNNGLYLMRPLGQAVVQQAQAAADTSVVLDRDPSPTGNTISSGDQVVLLFSDGTYRKVQVSSWTAATLTLGVGALPAAIDAGTTLWNFGIYTDTEPDTSLAFPKLDTPTSTVKDYPFTSAGGFAGWEAGQPLMIYCPNATNATKLNYAEYAATVG